MHLDVPVVSLAPFWHLLGASGRPFFEDFGARKRIWTDDRLKGRGPYNSVIPLGQNMEKKRPGGTRQLAEKVIESRHEKGSQKENKKITIF